MLPHFVGTKPLLFRWPLIVIFSGEGSGAHLSPNHLQARISIFLYLSILGSMFQSNDRFADGKRILMVLFAWKKVAESACFPCVGKWWHHVCLMFAEISEVSKMLYCSGQLYLPRKGEGKQQDSAKPCCAYVHVATCYHHLYPLYLYVS